MSSGAGGAVRAGAAYEAILIDKVTGNVNRIVDSLDRLQNAFKQTAGATGPLTVKVSAAGSAISGAGRRVDVAGDRFISFARKLRMAQVQVNSFGQAIGQASIHVGQAMMRMGRRAQLGGLGLAAFIASSISEADRHRQVVSSLYESWGDGADGAIAWAEKFATDMNRNTTDALEGLLMLRGVIGGLGDAGHSAAEIDELAKSLYKLGIDFGAFGAGMTDAEGILKIIQALGGEGQELKRFGIMAQEEDVRAYAESVGAVWGNLTQAEKLWYRVLNLQDQMRKRGRIGAAERERFGFQSTVKAMKAAFKTLQRTVGTELEQFGINFAKVVAQVLDNVTKIEGAGRRLLGIMTGLLAGGTGLVAVGFALTTFGIGFLALFSMASSFMAILPVLITFVNFVAIGASAWAAFGAGAAVVGLVGGKLALAAIAGINFENVVKRIGFALGRLGQTLGDTTRLAFFFGARDEWDRVWEVIALGGKIAFVQLARDIRNMLTVALLEAFVGAFEEMHSWMRAIGAVGLWPRPFPQADGKKKGTKKDSLFEMQKQFAALLALMAADAEAKAKADAAAGASGSGGTDPAEERRSMLPGGARSVGAFGASFARNSGLFAPDIDAQEKGNEIAGQQLIEAKKTNTILRERPSEPTELVMQ